MQMENNEEKPTKIKFFKKIWYSIARPSKYEEMKQTGAGESVKYFFTFIFLVSIILAIVAACLQTSIVNESILYLDEKLPEIKFKDNKLTIEKEEATILDEDKFEEYFGSVVVINPLIEKEQAIDEYNSLLADKNNVIVFLNDQYIVITNKYNPESDTEEGLEAHNYSDVSSKYLSDTSREYNKSDIIEYLRENTSYTYYVGGFFGFYFIHIILLYVIYILLISVSLWLVTKIPKFKWTFKNTLMNTIYSSTLSVLVYAVYLISNYFIKFRISFMDIISIFLIFVYLFIILWKDKNKS